MKKIKKIFTIITVIMIVFSVCDHTKVFAAPQWTFYIYGHMFGRYYGNGSGAYNSIATRKLNLTRNELVGKVFSFDSFGLSMHLSDGTAIVDEVVKNQVDGKKYQCVGFVPFDGNYPKTSNIANADWAHDNYGNFNTLDEAKAFVSNKNGVLYNETANEENIQSIEALSQQNSARTIQYNNVICVWFVSENKNPLSEMTHYEYDNLEFSGITPIDYKPTTEGVDITASSNYTDIDFTITINPDANNDGIINVNLAEIIADLITIEPGDTVTYNIDIIDKSGRNYSYVPQSGKIGTKPLEGNGILGTGFEGYKIPNPSPIDGQAEDKLYSFVPHRINNTALQALLKDTSDPKDLSDENIGKALYDMGYGEELSESPISIFTNSDGSISYKDITSAYLGDFYLDYFNFQMNTDPENQSQTFTSFPDLIEDELIDTLVVGDTSTLVPETNPTVANALYYVLYGRALSADNNTIYYWMNGHEDEFDQHLMQTFQKNEDGSSTLSFKLKMDGQIANNAFQNMQFGVGLQFQMQAEGADVSPQSTSGTESLDPSIANTNDAARIPLLNISVFICCTFLLILLLKAKYKKNHII